MTRYCSCGRKIAVARSKGRAGVIQSKNHDLCQKCWKAERDRERNTVRELNLWPFTEAGICRFCHNFIYLTQIKFQ